MVNYIVENKNVITIMDLNSQLELKIKVGVNLQLNEQKEDAEAFILESYGLIEEIIENNLIEDIRFDLNVLNDPPYLEISREQIPKFEVLLRDIYNFCKLRCEFIDERTGYKSDQLNQFMNMCKDLLKHINLLYKVRRIDVLRAYSDMPPEFSIKYNKFKDPLTSKEEREMLKLELESTIRDAEIRKISDIVHRSIVRT